LVYSKNSYIKLCVCVFNIYLYYVVNVLNCILPYYFWFPRVLAIEDKRNKNFSFYVINIMQFHSKRGKVVYILWHLVKLNYTTENTYNLTPIVGFIIVYNIYQQWRWGCIQMFKKYILQVGLINVKHGFWKYFLT